MRNLALVAAVVAGCHTSPRPTAVDSAAVRAEIEQVIAAEMAANRAKDIEAFLADVDPEFVLLSNEPADRGRHIDRAAMKADILRDWGVIAEMIEVRRWITSLGPVTRDTAVVFTDQRYHRTMKRPDPADPTLDDVVTTQRHEEHWARRADGWKVVAIRELGGEIFVNGEPYTP